MPSPSTDSPQAVTTSRTGVVRLIAVVGAVIGALISWIIITQAFSIELVARSGGPTMMPVGPAAVIMVSALACLVGWALLAILERKTKHAARIWTAIAAVVTVLSLAGPLNAGPSAAATIGLIVLHLVTAAVFVPLVAWTAFRTSRIVGTPR
jgi:hypothetical protein